MDQIIKQLNNYALTGRQVLEIIDNKANILTYPQLMKYDNIDDALGPHGALILMYMTTDNYGHWTCVFRRDDNTLEFFDSLGGKPDDQIMKIPEYYRNVSGQDMPHLTALLYNSGDNIIYNEFKLQEESEDVNTCGRFVALRLFYRHLTQEQFAKLMTMFEDYNPDDVVSLLTFNVGL